MCQQTMHCLFYCLPAGTQTVAGRDIFPGIRQRQAEGIEAAKARGVRFGRPPLETPEHFEKTVHLWEKKKINIQEALERSGMSESTFYRKARMYRTPKK